MSRCCCGCCDQCKGGTGGGGGGTGGGGGGTGGGGGGTGGGGGGKGGGGGAGGGKGPAPVGTWLLIRFDQADAGARPIPSTDVFWESPDIWLTGGDAFGNPIGGKPATVFVRVWNLGLIQAAPVQVAVSYITPSLGVPPSAPFPIGTAWGVVRAQSYTVFSCEWTPPVETQDVHACLIATCSAPLQGDVPTAPADPVSDRHTGQHNLTILPGSEGLVITGAFHLTNLAPMAAAIDFMAAGSWRTVAEFPTGAPLFHPSVAAAVTALDRPIASAQMRSWARRASVIQRLAPVMHLRTFDPAAIGDVVRVTLSGHHRKIQSVPVVPRSDRVSVPGSTFAKVGESIHLEALQQTTVNVSITVPPSHGHPWFIAHLAQATGGMLSGGYTVVVKLGP